MPVSGVFIMQRATSVRVGCTAIVLSLGLGTAAHSSEPLGQISSIQGSALISQGAQYVPAREGMSLRELDRVVIMEDSSAVLAFADGCEYTMGEMDLLTVSSTSACQSSTSAASSGNADVVGNAAAQSQTAKALEQAAIGQLGASGGNDDNDYNKAGLIGLGVAAAAGFVWAATSDDDNNNRRVFLSPQ
jgi:hypothetical protein